MKKMTIIIPIITMLVISALILLYMNFEESSRYSRFKGFDVESLSIRYENNVENSIKIVEMIRLKAKENDVILTKSIADSKINNCVNVYVSVDNTADLIELLNKKLKINFFKNRTNKESFISTYDHKDDNQIGIINDLFDDHCYTYYLMDQMIENTDSLFGTYFIYYSDFENYSNFVNEVNDLLGYDVKSSAFLHDIQDYVVILISGSLLFLLLFYFIFQVYEYYNNSQKIGCMKLLGFDTGKINRNMISKNMKIYLITILFIVILILVFVKNIMLFHILLIVIINLLITLITYFISNWSCIIISKTYQVTNILKKQNTSSKIGKVSYKFRIVMIVMLVCFSVVAFENFRGLYEKMKIYNNSKNLLEYGVLSSTTSNEFEYYAYEKHYNLYLSIVNSKELETVYANFHDYDSFTDEDWLNLKKVEAEGTYYLYDSIDKNYLKREKIQVYNLENKRLDVDEIEGIYFLFPKSKKNVIEPFKKYQDKELTDYYHQFDEKYTFRAYLYDDRVVDTYQVTLKKYIENPILRVINDSINVSYITTPEGISVFGNGLNTGLKIKSVDGDQKQASKILSEYIDKAGLSSIILDSSFITYKDYFNDEILESQLLLLFISLSIIIIFIVYSLISFQLLKLYIKSEKQKILVKKLLGFNNNDIFKQLFNKNLNNTLIAFVLSLLILMLIKKLNITFIVIMLIILILDFIITLLSTKSTKLTTIYLDLKGGNYD